MGLSKITMQKFGSLFAILFLCAGCGAGMPVSAPWMGASVDSSSLAVDLSNSQAVSSKAMQILSDNCTSCHTATSGPAGVFGLTDVNHLVQQGLVVPGQPDSSPLVATIEGNRMPPGGPLSTTDKQVIRSWILGGAPAPTDPPASTPSNPGSTPTPSTPGTTPVPVTGTLEQKAVAILTNNCYACHGTVSNGGLSRINDPAYLISSGFITPGNPSTSKIYDSINAGRMPLGGGSLSAADIQTISDWITAGANAPAAGTEPPPPELPPLGPTFQSLQANVFLPKCAGCHSGSNPSDGVRLDSYTTIKSNIRKIYSVSYNGEMPPRPSPKLSSAELNAISDWMNAGSPNN